MSETLKDKLRKKRQKIKDRSSGGNVIFLREGTTRIRILPVPPEEDWSYEMTHFYLGNEIKGVFSPVSVGKPCPIMEHYQVCKTEDKELAKKISPRKKGLVAAIVYEDESGKKIDEEKSGKLVMIPTGILTSLIDMFLDPELGDFTDPKEGYDVKIRRTGTGITDTEYSATPARPSSISPKWAKPVDLRKMVEGIILPYEEIEDKLAQFLADVTDDEEPRPSKPRLKKRKKSRGDE